MLKSGTPIVVTKGYNGVKGEILDPMLSPLEFYVVRLENGMHPVIGPSAFRVIEHQDGPEGRESRMREDKKEEKHKRASVKIREMVIDDLADVFHLGEEIFSVEKTPNTYRTWDEYEVIELYYADSEFCIVAEMDENIIGFALATTITKARSAWKYGHLIWLGVDPIYQRSGIAERLFKRFREIMLANKVRMLVVDTDAENLPALRFFRKLGFVNPSQHIYMTMNLAVHRHSHK
jgi:ribosomal protein S18 acetylase RimI-like enzyme